MKINKLSISLVALTLVAVLSYKTVSGKENLNTVILSKSNTLVLSAEVTGQTVGEVIAKAKELDAGLSTIKARMTDNTKPLYLFLNTPGGSIQSGLEMIEALNGIGRPVNTITLFAASMGFQIAQNLGDRLILKNGILMSHRAAGEFSGSFGGTSPSQVESRYRLWMQRINELDQQTVKRTGGKQTLDSYQKAYSTELWLTGAQAVDGGYADKITLVKCDASLSGTTTHTVELFGAMISYDMDNCPINTSPMNIKLSTPDGKVIYSADQKAEITRKFIDQFSNKQKQVVPMYW